MTIADATNAVDRQCGASSTTATTVVLSQNATGAGVASGDSIQFTISADGNAVDDLGWFKGALQLDQDRVCPIAGSDDDWAIATDPTHGANAVPNGLDVAAKISVQIVVIANTPLRSAPQGSRNRGARDHCNTARIPAATAWSASGSPCSATASTDPTLITGPWRKIA